MEMKKIFKSIKIRYVIYVFVLFLLWSALNIISQGTIDIDSFIVAITSPTSISIALLTFAPYWGHHVVKYTISNKLQEENSKRAIYLEKYKSSLSKELEEIKVKLTAQNHISQARFDKMYAIIGQINIYVFDIGKNLEQFAISLEDNPELCHGNYDVLHNSAVEFNDYFYRNAMTLPDEPYRKYDSYMEELNNLLIEVEDLLHQIDKIRLLGEAALHLNMVDVDKSFAQISLKFIYGEYGFEQLRIFNRNFLDQLERIR